jgi:hypothetical protein
MAQISSFLKFSPNEAVLDDWEILDDPGSVQVGDFLAVLIGLIFFIIPGCLALWDVISRPWRKGYLCLTNWRLVYYERGEGLFKNHHRVISVNLEDVYGIHCDFERRWLGQKSLYLRVHTRSEDGFWVKIGHTGTFLTYLPLIGRFFERRSIGKDALWVPKVLYDQVQIRRAALVDPTSRF